MWAEAANENLLPNATKLLENCRTVACGRWRDRTEGGEIWRVTRRWLGSCCHANVGRSSAEEAMQRLARGGCCTRPFRWCPLPGPALVPLPARCPSAHHQLPPARTPVLLLLLSALLSRCGAYRSPNMIIISPARWLNSPNLHPSTTDRPLVRLIPIRVCSRSRPRLRSGQPVQQQHALAQPAENKDNAVTPKEKTTPVVSEQGTRPRQAPPPRSRVLGWCGYRASASQVCVSSAAHAPCRGPRRGS